MQALLDVAIIGILNLSVDISTTNQPNKMLHMQMMRKYQQEKEIKEVVIYGVPDVAAITNRKSNWRRKISP